MHLLKRLKKIKYTIILLLIGSATGLFIYQNRKTKAVWRVEYSFRDDQGIQSFLHKDTLIIGKDFKYRNYTSSIADTLREEGIIRHELKVYAPQTATEENSRNNQCAFSNDYQEKRGNPVLIPIRNGIRVIYRLAEE
jgi:hypothetical protein